MILLQMPVTVGRSHVVVLLCPVRGMEGLDQRLDNIQKYARGRTFARLVATSPYAAM